jgi:hypothetical protein
LSAAIRSQRSRFSTAHGHRDQLPVSENEDIQVEMPPSTTPPTATNVSDKRGVLGWAFDAKPGDVKDIAFAWAHALAQG